MEELLLPPQKAELSKTPRRLGFGFLASLMLFATTRGCGAVNASPSWLVGAGWFAFAAALSISAIWTWEHTANRHVGLRVGLSLAALIVFTVGTYPSIADQYRREHSILTEPAAPVVPVPSGHAPEAPKDIEPKPKPASSRRMVTPQPKTKATPDAPQVGTVNNCPNGICISGGTVTNPTVNNNFTPSPKLDVESKFRNRLEGQSYVTLYHIIVTGSPVPQLSVTVNDSSLTEVMFAQGAGSWSVSTQPIGEDPTKPISRTLFNVFGPNILQFRSSVPLPDSFQVQFNCGGVTCQPGSFKLP